MSYLCMSAEDKPDTFAVFHVLTNEEADQYFQHIDHDKKGYITQEDLLTALRSDVALAVRLHLPGTEAQQEVVLFKNRTHFFLIARQITHAGWVRGWVTRVIANRLLVHSSTEQLSKLASLVKNTGVCDFTTSNNHRIFCS